jgi:UDP-glucuronate decarboxylase
MCNVLVTGAAGFLGSHISYWHLQRGDHVVGVDDFSSSSPTSEHLKLLRRNANFLFVPMDISIEKQFAQWNDRYDVIYNFACPASPPRYQSMPIKTMNTCVIGTQNVLELAHRTNAVVVHASTSEVYGDPTCRQQNELYRGNVNSYGPRSCYDEGKRAAEALCYDYLNSLGVDARLVRIFNTYGIWMDPDDGRVVTNFIKQAIRNEPITVYGDGTQTRSFCYVNDLVKGIISMGELSQNPKMPINLGNPTEFTVKRLAELVLSMFPHSRSTLVYKDLPIDDPQQRCPDISNAINLLGWQPSVSIEAGLHAMIPYMKDVVK